MLVYQRVPNKTSPKSNAFVPLEPKHQSFPAKITPFHRFFPNVLEKMATESYPPRPGTQRSLEPCDVFVGPLLSAVRAGDRILEDSEGRSCHPKKGAGRKKLGVFFGGNPQLLTASNWGLIRNTSNGEEKGNLYCFCRQKAATFIIWKAQASTHKDKEMYSKLWKNVLATMTNVVMW